MLKHFPGHGSAGSDTHLGLADVTESWQEEELIPYRQLMAANLAEGVMVAHVIQRKLDPVRPASLSRPVITGLLREKLGFEGPVFSDDLQMGAIRHFYDLNQTVLQAVTAGTDVLVFANYFNPDPDLPDKIVPLLESQ